MSGTYKATGITLKGVPMGESDRLLTVLTREFGLIRAVAPGSRKHESSLRGRSGLFVVNQLLIAKGRNLDKIVQAEGLASYTGLSQDLRKLTVGQYLAELALYQALSDHPQEELFVLLNESLTRLEQLPGSAALSCLAHAAFQLLTLAGVSPQVDRCCISQKAIAPDLSDTTEWQVGFHPPSGGVVSWSAIAQTLVENPSSRFIQDFDLSFSQIQDLTENRRREQRGSFQVAEGQAAYRLRPRLRSKPSSLGAKLTSVELALLQQLPQPDLIQADGTLSQVSNPEINFSTQNWLSIERVLRQYAQYHFDRPIQSATLIDTCFSAGL